MKDPDKVFAALARSRFRCRFHLAGADRRYLADKGLPAVLQHARDFITARLASATPHNDDKQTPLRGHPVFVAQHATATCCRSCLHKWHAIPRGHALTPQQYEYVIAVIGRWLINESERHAPEETRARRLPHKRIPPQPNLCLFGDHDTAGEPIEKR